MNMFIDVETTGLIGNGKDTMKWDVDFKKFPRIVSIAWKIGDKSEYHIVNQKGFPIPPGATAIHGITDETCIGKHFIDNILLWFVEDALTADYIIGHNIYFDTSVIKANTIRSFGTDTVRTNDMIKALDKHKRICTMRRAAKYMHGWKNLEALHASLFGCDVQDCGFTPHRSDHDIQILEKCFNQMLASGIMTMPDKMEHAPGENFGLPKI